MSNLLYSIGAIVLIFTAAFTVFVLAVVLYGLAQELRVAYLYHVKKVNRGANSDDSNR